MNAQNMVKRYQILSMIDTAKDIVAKNFSVYQFDFIGRMYPLTAHFHPQGNDIARGLHRFHEGAEIKTKQDLNWLAIAGANHWGKQTYISKKD